MATDKWISVNDRLPERGEETWVFANGVVEIDWFDDDRGRIGIRADGSEFVQSGWYVNSNSEITFWMPLERPLPPKETD